MNIILRIVFFLTLLAIAPHLLQAQTVVIVNNSVPASSIVPKELLDVYTLNKVHWDDGSRITVFDLKRGQAKEEFYAHIDMSEEDLQRIWLRKQFTGKARPPRSMANEDELIDMVNRTPGAIGYASARKIPKKSNVRIVARVTQR